MLDALYVALHAGRRAPASLASNGDLSRRTGAALLVGSELVLILPALLFLAAVVVRYVQPLARPAQQVVTWYTTRSWTLSILLIALPCAALVTGCAGLLWSSSSATDGRAVQFSVISARLETRLLAMATLTAGLILTVVILHMLAN